MDSKFIKKCDRQLNMLFCKDITKNIEKDFRKIAPRDHIISEITMNGSQCYLTERARASFRDLFEIIINSIEFQNVTNNDVFRELRRIYVEFLSKNTKPTIEEIIEKLHVTLNSLKKNLNLLIPTEGITIEQGCKFQIGEITLEERKEDFFEKFNLVDGVFKDLILKRYESHNYWSKITIYGSEKYAEEYVTSYTQHHLSIFLIYITACSSKYFTCSRIRLLLNNMDGYKTLTQLSWEEGVPSSLSYKSSLGTFSIVNIDEIMMIGFKKTSFHISLPKMVDKKNKNEIESAICRCLYWFGEAYKEPVLGMKFLKLWSCIECFFSIDHEEVTTANAVGIATVLKTIDRIFPHTSPKNIKYSDYKKTAKKFYKLRSEITHSAMYDHIQVSDVEELSVWVISVVYIMIYFVEEKLYELSEVKKIIQKNAAELVAKEASYDETKLFNSNLKM
ncbi:MAG: hypothetical protein KGO49_00750 [Gammaproteobacteria bacterium]|nr:hypothetical protein [Gammaproteobacteria bacterium]